MKEIRRIYDFCTGLYGDGAGTSSGMMDGYGRGINEGWGDCDGHGDGGGSGDGNGVGNGGAWHRSLQGAGNPSTRRRMAVANDEARRTERVFRCAGCIGHYECSIHGRRI